MQLKECLMDVKTRMSEACEKAGRDIADVTLVAVSKTVDADAVGCAIELGQTDFGENRIESLEPKAGRFPDARWHFIGNIQSRKISRIVAISDLVHSLDRADIISKLDSSAAKIERTLPVLIEVNVSGEETKSGFRPSEVMEVLSGFAKYPNLEVRGLMTMAPQGAGEVIRSTFAGLRRLKESSCAYSLPSNVCLDELSMGMSEDFETAIEEGATLVRVGRSVFGSLHLSRSAKML